jgi:hypothetical protein
VSPLTASRAATSASTLTRQVAPAVPPGFLPRAAPATPAASCVDLVAPVAFYVALMSLATSRAAPMTPTSPVQCPGHPPLVWPSSSIAYICRPRQHVAPAPVPPTLMMSAHRLVTGVPVTPPVNPHQMVTHTKADFWMPREPLILAAMTTSSPPSRIPTSVHAALTDLNWCAAMEEEYGALMSNGI